MITGEKFNSLQADGLESWDEFYVVAVTPSTSHPGCENYRLARVESGYDVRAALRARVESGYDVRAALRARGALVPRDRVRPAPKPAVLEMDYWAHRHAAEDIFIAFCESATEEDRETLRRIVFAMPRNACDDRLRELLLITSDSADEDRTVRELRAAWPEAREKRTREVQALREAFMAKHEDDIEMREYVPALHNVRPPYAWIIREATAE